MKLLKYDACSRIIEDIQNDGVDFVYSVIEYTDLISKAKRKKREEFYRTNAAIKYGDRLYNAVIQTNAVNVKRRSEASQRAK